MPVVNDTPLFSDDSKLGQKLLEKMGWKKGSALGLKENGNPEPIKVSAKSDRRGTVVFWPVMCYDVLGFL